MIATRRFVFLHLHKSGGTFVNRFLAEFFPEARQVGYHLPRAYVPTPLRGLPLLGTVRNPWDYYVSWYSFQSAKPQPNALFDACSEGGRLDFAGTVRNLLTLADDAPRLDAVLSRLPAQFPNRGLNLTGPCLAPLSGSGMGFYGFLYRRMYGDAQDVSLVPMERLRTGLVEALEAIGVEVTAPMRGFIERRDRINASEHRHYGSYYDDALRALVAERDAEVIARHGYRFEAAPAA